MAHVDRLGAADSAAQLRHGERQRLQPLAVQAFGYLGAYLKRRGKISMLCLQLIPQPGRLTRESGLPPDACCSVSKSWGFSVIK